MSSNDRRAASYNIGGGTRPRVVSSRVAGEIDYKASRQGEESSINSPLLSEKMEHLRGSTSSARGVNREPGSSAIDRRTERTTVTTRDKIHVKTRNPVKESPNAGNRGEFERSRSKKTASPPRRKEKDAADGTQNHFYPVTKVYDIEC
jgi:gamma-tubulin complex component 2